MPLLTYRSFASPIGTFATLIAAVIVVAGSAGSALLLAEGAPLRAAAAASLTVVFTLVVMLLLPRLSVVLYRGAEPALFVTQRSRLTRSKFEVQLLDGTFIAWLVRPMTSRLGRDRWNVLMADGTRAAAREDAFLRSLLRRTIGKFSRRFETDYVITSGGVMAGRIARRHDAEGTYDVLTTVPGSGVDPRASVGLATIILGSEP